MSKVAPRPVENGYIHPDTLLAEAVQAELDAVGPPRIIEEDERADFHNRDVGASLDYPWADVFTRSTDRSIIMRMDERTAAVLMYAGRLLAANYEAHAREVRMVADQMPTESYGRQNRITIAERQERIARRMRVLERSYQVSVDREYHGI